MSQIRKDISHFYREFRFAWARAWKFKSIFIPPELKNKAYSYLHDHQEKLLFILGSGRSGTQLISNLLNTANNAAIFHEPNFIDDVGNMDLLRRSYNLTEKYWINYRNPEIYKRWIRNGNSVMYGEVNGTIRYHANIIKKLYPKSKIFLLTRDGRGVVRSMMGWPQFYGAKSKGAYTLRPLPGDPFRDEWVNMSRFEKICWGWQDSNKHLMKHIPCAHWLQLEKLVSNYEYCSEKLFDVINISVPHEIWKLHTSSKSKNASLSYTFPPWDNWDISQKRSFERICGDTMTRLGYEL